MTNIQFRVLYHEFLFRVVDLELLAPQGDIAKLLGQFGAALIFLSFGRALGALFFSTRGLSPQALRFTLWGIESSLITMTMLVVGIFAVLSWDSAFPDRRDVMVLAPLPVRPQTLFLAKGAALATALSLTVLALNAVSGLIWPLIFAPANSGLAGVIRSLAAYWVTVFAAGGFIFCCVLGLQGLAAQLPRRQYLRISQPMQIAVLCLLLSGYFFQPPLAAARASMMPSYWFFGLYQVLNGSDPAEMRAPIESFASRALIGLVIAGIGAGTAFLLSYIRTLRKIVEEPDIVPGSRGIRWLPRFGDSITTAIVHFSIRTLMRSRQHRVILAFYLGVGFAIVLISLQTPAAQRQLNAAASAGVLYSSVLMLCCSVSGVRAVFAMPLQVKANWLFRTIPLPGRRETLTAVRRSFIVLAVLPILAITAAILLATAPWRIAAGHVVALGLFGIFLTELSLSGFPKIPFTCSYLPGKSPAHKAFLTVWSTLLFMATAVGYELKALDNRGGYMVMIAVLCVAIACARWWAVTRANSPEAALLFEEAETPAIFALDLHRDGRFQA